jgi:peptide chain release factor subunit 1
MITREQINELAQFEDHDSCALTYYFQPTTPRNKAHKEEAILTKDLAREALRHLESSRLEAKAVEGRNEAPSKEKLESARADLDRIVRLSHDLLNTRGNGLHAKAIFACSSQNFWREYDLPAQLDATQLVVNRHFHLKPLAHLLGAFPSLGIVLVDRHRARMFDLRLGEATERMDFFHSLPHRGRSDGFAGYDAGHAERGVADEARQHFKTVAQSVKEGLEKGIFDKWILGCQEVHWPQIEAQLHPYALQRLLGSFPAEVAYERTDEIRLRGEQIFREWQEKRRHELVNEAIDQARSNARGATGLRRVLQSLEVGEVQTLLLGEDYHAQAIECGNCGHLDAHLVNACPACGQEKPHVVDVAEAILPRVIRGNIELFYVKDDPEFDKVGNIAALLRFRSEQKNNSSNVQSINEGRPDPSLKRGRREGFVARRGGFDERMIL